MPNMCHATQDTTPTDTSSYKLRAIIVSHGSFSFLGPATAASVAAPTQTKTAIGNKLSACTLKQFVYVRDFFLLSHWIFVQHFCNAKKKNKTEYENKMNIVLFGCSLYFCCLLPYRSMLTRTYIRFKYEYTSMKRPPI